MVAQGSFPQLRRIQNCDGLCSCDRKSTCDLHTFLPQILINKGHQLTVIEIPYVCNKSKNSVWKALRYCTAARTIRFEEFYVASNLSITYEDVKAIFHLPHLQHFTFTISTEENDACVRLRELIGRAAEEHKGFEFFYSFKNCRMWPEAKFSLHRICY